MSFSTQAIKYGWLALASLGVITGATIYMSHNQRQRVEPEDIIELVLGVHERCLATQTGTNADGSGIYAVTPPSFVQAWAKTNAVYMGHYSGWGLLYRYTNYWPSTSGVPVVVCYTTCLWQAVNYAKSWTATGGHVWVREAPFSNVAITTSDYEIVTNTIGWHVDRDTLVSIDEKIKALVPCYVDTNSVYDGTTNIVMLTFTGLLTSLHLGDGTNFTSVPCWTNSVSTNWIIDYTSYWPSTNGAATNINYTSDYRQVVNYAQSWTATGGHVWVTSSNWASQVVQTTNVATYGDYPWQIYPEDLQERYKVLNALQVMLFPACVGAETNFNGMQDFRKAKFGGYMGGGYYGEFGETWYSWQDSDDTGRPEYLGLTDGTKYDVLLDGRSPISANLKPYIDLGVARSFWHGTDKGMEITLRKTSSETTASSAFFFLTMTNNIRIVGGYHSPYLYEGDSYTFDYTANSVVVSASSGFFGYSVFIFYPILTIPFNYCTNKYW